MLIRVQVSAERCWVLIDGAIFSIRRYRELIEKTSDSILHVCIKESGINE